MKTKSNRRVFQFLQTKPFIGFMVLLILAVEWFTVQSVNMPLTGLCWWKLATCISLLVLLIFFLITGHQNGYYSWDYKVLKRFLSNDFGSNWWSVFCLMVFIVELSWLADVGYDFIFKSGTFIDKVVIILDLLVIALSTIALIALFPRWNIKKTPPSLAERKLLITPISLSDRGTLFTQHNLDLLSKPLVQELHSNKEGYNGKLAGLQKILVILPIGFDNAKIDSELKENTETFKNNREFLERELSEKYGSKLRVSYSNLADYNNFDSCYKAIETALEKVLENEKSSAVLYISPGTSVPSAALSIHGVQDDRLLIYANQSTEDVVIEAIELNVKTIKNVIKGLERELDSANE